MMKRFLLLLVVFAMTMAASGQQLTKSPRLAGQQIKGKYEFRTTHKSAERSSQSPMIQGRKAPVRVDVITDQPEGELKTYQRSGGAMFNFWGYLFTTHQDGGAMQMVFAEDGKTVYIQDPLCYGEGVGAWVVGELTDDGRYISVPLGQYVSYNEEYGYGLVLAWGSTDVFEFEDEDGVVIVDYKTDRVKRPDALAGMYATQLLLYKDALEECLGLPVKECLIYSIHHSAEIEVYDPD